MTFDGVSPKAMEAYRRLEEMTGGPLRVNSAYRSPEHNAKVGGVKHSQHMDGNAFDFGVSHLNQAERGQLIEQMRAAGFRGIGVYNNALHADVGPERAWGPSYSRDSLPEWAKPHLTADVAHRTPLQPHGDDTMNKMMMLRAMPKFSNALNPEDFRYA